MKAVKQRFTLTSTLAAVLLGMGLSGCQSQDAELVQAAPLALQVTSSSDLFTQDKLNGQKAISLGDGRWLANSENLGIFLFDQQGMVLSQTNGNYEGLDIRKQADGSVYALTVNKEVGAAELMQVGADNQITLVSHLRLESSVIGNLCLYQPEQGGLQALLLTADHHLEQRLLLDELGNNGNNLLIRRLPAPPHSSACVASDKQDVLFVAEEAIGVWQYPLNPERNLSREAIAMVAPFGELKGEIKDISLLDDGSVLLALPDMKKLAVYRQQQDGWQGQYLTTGAETAPESVSGVFSGNQLNLSWFDDASDRYVTSKIVLAPLAQADMDPSIPAVKARVETAPVSRFGDAADDPAIWVNAKQPQHSRILGTDKSAGLYVFDLNGKQTQFINSGRINNVDISYGFSWQGQRIDLAAASNRTRNTLSLYAIDGKGQVTALPEVPTTLPDVYGLCSYRSPVSGEHFVFVNDESGRVQQYHIVANGDAISGEMVREFKLDSQPEGCVADEVTQTLYVGEEDVAIWQTSAEPAGGPVTRLTNVDNQILFDDIEGLSIYQGEKQRYLVASSQGNDSYVLYSLPSGEFAGRFQVTANYAKGIDGASETDGLAVSSANLGGEFSQGLLVVQDGRNVMPDQPQNFKLISWQDIAEKLGLPQ